MPPNWCSGIFATGVSWRCWRYRVVQRVPALRERELVTTYRYERLFTDFLRARCPRRSRVHIVEFRGRDDGDAQLSAPGDDPGGRHGHVRATAPSACYEVRRTFGVVPRRPPAPSPGADLPQRAVTVVTFPVGASPAEVAEQVRRELEQNPPTS